MRVDEINLHGVAVALGDVGLLIVGQSGSGKSALAAGLLSERRFGVVRLVSDDRVLLKRHGDRIIARPHPAITGALELRGFGIVRLETLDAVVLRGIIRLSDQRPDRLPETKDRCELLLGLPLPRTVLPSGTAAIVQMITIWPYFRDEICHDRSILHHRP
jgi:HPr kinase/phosphorylase